MFRRTGKHIVEFELPGIGIAHAFKNPDTKAYSFYLQTPYMSRRLQSISMQQLILAEDMNSIVSHLQRLDDMGSTMVHKLIAIPGRDRAVVIDFCFGVFQQHNKVLAALAVFNLDCHGYNPLHYFSKNLNPAGVNQDLALLLQIKEMLGEYFGTTLLKQDWLGNTPMHYAIRVGNKVIVEAMLSALSAAQKIELATLVTEGCSLRGEKYKVKKGPRLIPGVAETAEEIDKFFNEMCDEGIFETVFHHAAQHADADMFELLILHLGAGALHEIRRREREDFDNLGMNNPKFKKQYVVLVIKHTYLLIDFEFYLRGVMSEAEEQDFLTALACIAKGEEIIPSTNLLKYYHTCQVADIFACIDHFEKHPIQDPYVEAGLLETLATRIKGLVRRPSIITSCTSSLFSTSAEEKVTPDSLQNSPISISVHLP